MRNASPTTTLASRSLASLCLLAVVASSLPIATLSFSCGGKTDAVVIHRHPLRLASHRRSDVVPRGAPSSSAGENSCPSSRRRADDGIDRSPPSRRRGVASASLGLALLLSPLATTTTTTMMMGPAPAFAYVDSDLASETVTEVVARLRSDAGDVDRTFGILEDISKIITEGKGVGGTLTYDGIKLGDGIAIADEDTTIYNPGLTLLTSTEKQQLVSAIVDNRNVGLSASPPGSGWSENNEYAFGYLKSKLDPLHMHELGGYLGILPYYGAVLYLAALYVQKNARDMFPLAYGLCVLGVFGPVLVLVASGP